MFPNPLPPMWQRIPDVQLFSAGLYLKTGGGLKSLDKILKAKDAVVVALWEDPAQTYRLGGEELRPGVTATLLVPTPFDEGPPWVPVQAVVQSSAREFETGILNPWLDQVATIHFKPTFSIDKGRLGVETAGGAEASSSHGALRETLLWLAEHPDDTNGPTRLARRMLVENGHGLQRYGVSLMFADDAARAEAIERILPALAPDVATMLTQLHGLWHEADPTHRAGRALGLAHLLAPALEEGNALQKAHNMAVLATWMAGLFGARPERRGLQPATTLFVLLRCLRMVNRRPEALEHPDAALPTFPIAGASLRRVLLDLSRLPQNETDLERLVRCLALAEMGQQIARPRRDHLRPFRIVMPWVRGYPVASRTVGGRYDYLVSGWSFRGGELRDPKLPDAALRGVFLLDGPSVASSRAYARVIASGTPASRILADELKNARHPVLEDIGNYADREPMDVFATYREAAEHDNITRRRLFAAVSSAEWLLTRLERGDELPDVAFLPPVPPTEEGAGVRAHFMYWRMYCRSIAWTRSEAYGVFLGETLPNATALPMKLQTELLALLRRWAQQDDAHREQAAAWIGALDALTERYFDASDPQHERMDGEWLHQLAGALAVLDRERFTGLLDRWMEDPRARFDEADRIIDGTRAAGWRREFAATDTFARLHAKIVGVTGPEGAMARAEWTRAALDASRRAPAVRWLLDGRAERALLDAPAFEAWFRDSALADVRTGDDAVIRLLELALRVVSPVRVDRVVEELAAATTWSSSEFLKALADAGRYDAMLYRMLSTPDAGDELTARSAIEGALAAATTGEAQRDVAAAVVRLEQERGFDLGEVGAAVRATIVAYRPIRQALDGLAAIADAVRLLQPPLADVEPLVRAAGKWGVETGHPDLVRLVAWAIETHTRDQAQEAWKAALAGDSDGLVASFASLQLPDAAERAASLAEKQAQKDPNRRRTRNMMLRLQSAGVWEGVLGDALVDALDPSSAAVVLERLAAIEKALQAPPTNTEPAAESANSPGATEAADRAATEPAKADAAPAEDAATEPAEAVEAAAEDAATTPSKLATAPTEDAPTTPAAAEPVDPAVDRLRRAARESVTTLRKSWEAALSALAEDDQPAPPALLRRCASRRPLLWRLRPELVGLLRRLSAQTGATISDPKHVLTGDWWDDTTLELDLDSWRTVLETLAALQGLHNWLPGWAVRRDLVALLVRAADGSPAAADGASEGEEETSALAAFRAGFAADAPLDARRAAFGHGAVPALLRMLLERENGLQLQAKPLDGIDAIQLSWRRRR